MTLKLIKPTLLFYAIAVAAIYILGKISPSGPCTPGLGDLSFFLLLPIAGGLLLRNIYLTFKVDKSNLIIVILHIVALGLIFAVMW